MTTSLNRLVYLLIALIAAACVAFVAFLVAAQWPEWWKWVIFERTPMTWLQSMLLMASALVASLCLLLSYARDGCWREWLVLSTGFAYLALDERFAIHERIRDNILAPAEIRLPIFFWTKYGDFLLLCFMVIGLALLPRLIRVYRDEPRARQLFFAAVGIAALAVIMDSVDYDAYSLQIRRLEQFWEEVFEMTAMLGFLAANLIAWTGLAGNTAARRQADD